MERQAPFLKSVLQEANQHKRQELLRMANADQINAISELVMNTFRGTVPRSRHTITLLKPNITPGAKKKLKFTPQVSSAELAHELPFSDTCGVEPWDTPKERVESIKKAVKRGIRKKATDAAKKKAESLAKKALEWKTWKTP